MISHYIDCRLVNCIMTDIVIKKYQFNHPNNSMKYCILIELVVYTLIDNLVYVTGSGLRRDTEWELVLKTKK